MGRSCDQSGHHASNVYRPRESADLRLNIELIRSFCANFGPDTHKDHAVSLNLFQMACHARLDFDIFPFIGVFREALELHSLCRVAPVANGGLFAHGRLERQAPSSIEEKVMLMSSPLRTQRITLAS